MDSTFEWTISDDVEGLVEAITACKQDLVDGSREKNGASSKLLTCDVYVDTKLLELLALSKSYLPCVEVDEESVRVPIYRRKKKMSELVADFSVFRLHRSDVIGKAQARVVATFEVKDSSAPQMCFGTVRLVS